MKKYIFILLALPLILSSCLKNDTDTFGQIPGERIEQFNQEVNKILKDAPNGWVMTYYSGRALQYGGYKVYMKFDGNEKVTIASEISTWRGESIEEAAKETETSTYTLGKDYGPTLNFDTYNTLFHMFAEADTGLTIGAGEPGMGMGGDSEFIIMSADKDKIVLRGKKAQFDVTMTPLPADQTWEQSLKEYYTAYKSMDVMPSYQLQLGGKTYEMSRYNDVLFWRHFSFYLSEAEILDASFQYTLTGIMFRDPVVIDGISISEMKWDGNGYADAASGAKITKVVSNNTFTVTVPKVEATKVTVSVTPTNANEYYYVGVYPKSEEDNKTDAEIIRDIVLKASSSNVVKGTMSSSIKVKELTEYVAFAFGVYIDRSEKKNIASTTDLYKSDSFITPKDEPASEAYKAWLGTWTVTSTSSEITAKPLSFNVVFSEKVRNVSYTVNGWSITMLRDYSDYNGTAVLRSNGTMAFENEQFITQEDGDDFKWTCRFKYSGGYNVISGEFDVITLTLGANKTSATGVGYASTHTELGNWTATTMEYFFFQGNSYGGFKPADGFTEKDYPIGPYSLVKKSSLNVVPERILPICLSSVMDTNMYIQFSK